jgi:hypothetical protein
MRYDEIIKKEDKRLRERRLKLAKNETAGKKSADRLDENRFGIALSGGGIRSATINLGLLKTLNRFGILKQSDYLSTVSGGGYTGSYIHATLKNPKYWKDKADGYESLFAENHIKYMRSRGEYLFPGTGLRKLWNQFVLIVSYITSLLMSFVSPLIIVLFLTGIYMFIDETIQHSESGFSDNLALLLQYGGITVLAILALHYVLNVLMNFQLDVSSWLSKVETILIGIALLAIIWFYFASINKVATPSLNSIIPYLGFGLLLGILGLFTNPNSTSFHRFYRKQLSDAFLNFSGAYRNVLIKDLFQTESEKESDYAAPYPLINTCLNLQASNDPNFKGTKASDYFLLSPMYCGAKLTGYIPTEKTVGYKNMTLPAAVTISAAAVNPGMGIYSSKIMSILTTLLNLRLGYWTWNPLKLKTSFPLVWWPLYFFYELLSKIGTDNKMVNISDGGHIENLAVFELLRRKCRLIVAIDAGADPDFAFADLENLTIRARNELGLEIRFREGNIPEETIRPNPSHGYSRKRFAIADVYQLWGKVVKEGKVCVEHYENKKVSTFIYIKSSITAPQGKPELSPDEHLKYGTYKYKIYHPNFPHEPTSDQFFDPIQWEAYYQLGQYIGADILGLGNVEDEEKHKAISIDELITHFDDGTSLFEQAKDKEVVFDPVKPLPSRERGGVESVDEIVPVVEYEEKIVDKKVDYNM